MSIFLWKYESMNLKGFQELLHIYIIWMNEWIKALKLLNSYFSCILSKSRNSLMTLLRSTCSSLFLASSISSSLLSTCFLFVFEFEFQYQCTDFALRSLQSFFEFSISRFSPLWLLLQITHILGYWTTFLDPFQLDKLLKFANIKYGPPTSPYTQRRALPSIG